MISIIIPVYNVCSYLNKCIESILSQSYYNFECILIDDGSTDGSSDLCDCWANRDIRIRVVHQVNMGVSSARNKGLECAKGDYITFVDSDDWIEFNYLLVMMQYIEKSNVDLVVSGLIKDFKEESKIYVPLETTIFSLTIQNISFFVDLNQKYLLYGPYVKIYKKEIIIKNNILFDVFCSYGEDLLFNFNYVQYVNKIASVSVAYYHYRILGSDTLSTKFRINQFQEDYNQWKILKSFYFHQNLWCELSKKLLYNRLWGIIYDGIFLYKYLFLLNIGIKQRWQYLKMILQINEIDDLFEFQKVYNCSEWIKQLVLYRMYNVLFFYFEFRKLK